MYCSYPDGSQELTVRSGCLSFPHWPEGLVTPKQPLGSEMCICVLGEALPKLCEPQQSPGKGGGRVSGPRGRALGEWLGPEELVGNHLRVSKQMPEGEVEERRVG